MNQESKEFYLKEIDRFAATYPRRLRLSDQAFLKSVRPRVAQHLALDPVQEKNLNEIYERLTEPVRIKW